MPVSIYEQQKTTVVTTIVVFLCGMSVCLCYKLINYCKPKAKKKVL